MLDIEKNISLASRATIFMIVAFQSLGILQVIAQLLRGEHDAEAVEKTQSNTFD